MLVFYINEPKAVSSYSAAFLILYVYCSFMMSNLQALLVNYCNLIFFLLNQGLPVCHHYTQRGQCKFGPACKFDHPMSPMRELSYSPSASSLADMPVAPYPVGSSVGTLAPSFSSSELRLEHVSGVSKDSSSTRMSSSLSSSSSGSVGSILTKSVPVQSGVQQSGQASGTPASGGSGSTDVHTSS